MQRISDWDDAYTNAAYIPGGMTYPDRWRVAAEAFRNALPHGVTARLDLAYGQKPGNALDLFVPQNPKGLFIFVHGGYWMKFGRKDWSHLATDALAKDYAAALPSYTLAPEATITEIVEEIAAAINFAAGEIAGPIVLAGHSAGGQLVTRAVCEDSQVSAPVLARVKHVISISGVHDLRPLLGTKMNETLRLSPHEAELQSPALHVPVPGTELIALVGASERPEFIRQSQLLANVWLGLGAKTMLVIAPDRHHFNIIEGYSHPVAG
jgi:arylformamidase